MDNAATSDENALIAGETAVPLAAPADDLAWAIVKMQAGNRIIINEALIAAYQAASSAHTIRALNRTLRHSTFGVGARSGSRCRQRRKRSPTISTRGRGRGASPLR